MTGSTVQQPPNAIDDSVTLGCELQAPHALSANLRLRDERLPQPYLYNGGLLATLQQNNDLSVPTSSAEPRAMSYGMPSPCPSWSTPGTWSIPGTCDTWSTPDTWSGHGYYGSQSSPYRYGPPPTPVSNCYPEDRRKYQYTQLELSRFLPSSGTPPVLTPATDADDDEICVNDGVRAHQTPSEDGPPASKARLPPLAPRPGGDAPKRSSDGDDMITTAERKRRRLKSIAKDPKLSEQDRLLVRLKDEGNLPWKDIANRFTSEHDQKLKVAALQMRYKRLYERHRVWQDEDMKALESAHEYWEKHKWDIISAKGCICSFSFYGRSLTRSARCLTLVSKISGRQVIAAKSGSRCILNLARHMADLSL